MSANDRTRIRRLMDTYADDFERALRLEGLYKDEGYRLLRRMDMIISYLRKLRGQRLLDVGCGPGVVAVKINRELGLKVDAVDFSYGEAPDTYRHMLQEIVPVEPYTERLDEEALLIDLKIGKNVSL